MRILVVGAGVIGSVYAGRLAEAGHDVSILARGRRRDVLDAEGLHLFTAGNHLTSHPQLLSADEIGFPVDLTIVAVRATQLDAVLELLAALESPTVAFLQHLGPQAERVRRMVGPDRTVFAFPGIGGLFRDDGSVEYVEIAAQPTTIDANATRVSVLQSAIDSTGMRTALEADMAGWFATHSVFIACLGAGILKCDGSATKLASDPSQLRTVVQSVREGFTSLRTSGTSVTPAPLRVLFSRMPRWFAAAYWRRALRGPVGTVAMDPHVRASRDDEFAALCADVIDHVARPDTTPTMTALLAPWARPSQ